jgi:hypothetical protein
VGCPPGPPEWAAVEVPFVTPLLGFAVKSYMAGEDWQGTHECSGYAWEGVDWNIEVRPLHPYKHLLSTNTDIVNIEYEECWAKYFHAGWGFPGPPDLIFVAGRWAIDCGHDSFSPEIHPPAVLAAMRAGSFASHPATVANIWINGVYAGEPVELKIFPPPRPSPSATLTYAKPYDANAAFDVTVEDAVDLPWSPSYVRVRFTASPRQIQVDWDGEMHHQKNRGYKGRWHVYWVE